VILVDGCCSDCDCQQPLDCTASAASMGCGCLGASGQALTVRESVKYEFCEVWRVVVYKLHRFSCRYRHVVLPAPRLWPLLRPAGWRVAGRGLRTTGLESPGLEQPRIEAEETG
jgi:hypothetical protein